MVKPFLLVVVDRDKSEFAIEGPMTDDRPWNDVVVAAQNSGRRVICHMPGEGQTKEAVAQSMTTASGLKLVPPGSIVKPNSN